MSIKNKISIIHQCANQEWVQPPIFNRRTLSFTTWDRRIALSDVRWCRSVDTIEPHLSLESKLLKLQS